jgi:hypothetical protein
VLRTEVRALGRHLARALRGGQQRLPAGLRDPARAGAQDARGAVFQIHLPPEARLVSGKERVIGPQLEGHAPKNVAAGLPAQS